MKVLTLMNDGFEELECMGAVTILKRGGCTVDLVSVNNADKVTGRFETVFSTVKALKDVNLNDYDVLFIPGGPGVQNLKKNETALSVIKTFMDQNKVVAAICAAPTILGEMGYLKKKMYTCYTSLNADFGGTYIDKYCVEDGNIVTGRSAAAVIDFAFLLLGKLMGEEVEARVKKEIYY